ncbi:MAG: tetratricopeptide repeat protein [Betaproteobacteria bacterium]|jgi:predicted negative regulator of RcsB-dependent stress response|nr:tetratricopeptide repeat protein [Betaproteobacteria bacterium]
MATYDLEEQEQISELKTWWKMYGNMVTSVLLAVTVGVVGWQAWNWYQRNQTAEASVIYSAVQKATIERDAKRVREAAGELTERYPGTAYAAMAALTSARMQYDAGDLKTARAQLQWVAAKAVDKDLRDLGRLRLAHVLFDDKALDEALKLLGEEPGAAFTARFSELKGDILAAQGKLAEARAAYQIALVKHDALDKAADGQGGREAQYRELLQVKLDSIGGK